MRRPSFQEALLRADQPLAAAWLAEGADPAGSFADGSIPLIAAVTGGSRPVTLLLLDAGAPVNGRDRAGDTALIVAARKASADLVELLLGRGADARVANARGETAAAAASAAGAAEAQRWLRAVEDEPVRAALMSEAVGAGGVDRIATLLVLGAHPDTPARDGTTALMAAAEARRLDVARQLVGRKADVNLRTREGATALMALQRGPAAPGAAADPAADAAALARLLIEAGADVNARDLYGHSVLMWAEEFGNRDVIALLEAAGARR
jgi:ankyrin repeat protein